MEPKGLSPEELGISQEQSVEDRADVIMEELEAIAKYQDLFNQTQDTNEQYQRLVAQESRTPEEDEFVRVHSDRSVRMAELADKHGITEGENLEERSQKLMDELGTL